jgi:hypothetical protein
MSISETQQAYLNSLLNQLIAKFDLEELRTLCFELSIDFDSLRGEGKAAKARELVLNVLRTHRLSDLVESARGLSPGVGWPTVPPGFEELAAPFDSYLEEIGIESVSEPGPTFNISGPIQSGATFIGGAHTLAQPINIDMREGDTEDQDMGRYRGLSEKFDNFPDATRAITSRLERATQTVGGASMDETRRSELVRLINDLREQLVQAPAQRIDDAEKVSKRLEALLREVAEKKPDKDMIDITAESLTRAAQDVADLLPAVPAICARITDLVKELGR